MGLYEAGGPGRFADAFMSHLVFPKSYQRHPQGLSTPDPDQDAIHAHHFMRDLSDLQQGRLPTVAHEEKPCSLTAEALTLFALRNPLTEYGLQIDAAPAHLEAGMPDGTKGIDLVVYTPDISTRGNPYLGLNVKLKNKKGRDTFGLYPPLNIPKLNCSIGSWVAEQTEQEENYTLKLRQWIKEIAIQSLYDGGDIPQFRLFREYLIERIEGTLQYYYLIADMMLYDGFAPGGFEEATLLPEDNRYCADYIERLKTIMEVFAALKEQYCTHTFMSPVTLA